MKFLPTFFIPIKIRFGSRIFRPSLRIRCELVREWIGNVIRRQLTDIRFRDDDRFILKDLEEWFAEVAVDVYFHVEYGSNEPWKLLISVAIRATLKTISID